MGFEKEYVIRACNVYKKKFKNKPLRLEVLTEIIIRLQQKDQNPNGILYCDYYTIYIVNTIISW